MFDITVVPGIGHSVRHHAVISHPGTINVLSREALLRLTARVPLYGVKQLRPNPDYLVAYLTNLPGRFAFLSIIFTCCRLCST